MNCCKGSIIFGNGCKQCARCFAQLMEIAEELYDDSPCSYDHHGLCQTHSLQEKPCPHEQMGLIIKNCEGKEQAK